MTAQSRMPGLRSLPPADIQFVPPMLAVAVSAVPEAPQWQYEIKLDGYRAIVVKTDHTSVFSKRGHDFYRRHLAFSICEITSWHERPPAKWPLGLPPLPERLSDWLMPQCLGITVVVPGGSRQKGAVCRSPGLLPAVTAGLHCLSRPAVTHPAGSLNLES